MILTNAFKNHQIMHLGKNNGKHKKSKKNTFIRKCDDRKNNEQQSKLTVNGIHKTYTSYDSYMIKQEEVPMDEPVYLEFAVSQLSRLLLYDPYVINSKQILQRKKIIKILSTTYKISMK